ncbi:MAG: hypothetical protein J7647_10265 [Cyanobacteria bacterium SBLK]|nr:hypothetical protein [Cyanobacteria bacterium SBLK]
MDAEIEQLKQELDCDLGTIILEVTERSQGGESDIQSIDRWVEKLGFNPLGQGWIVANKKMAIAILCFILHQDLAYDSERMNRWKAQQISDRFIQFFGTQAKYLTNAEFAIVEGVGEIEVRNLRIWNPITEATFDTGICVCSPTHLGLLWVEDED